MERCVRLFVLRFLDLRCKDVGPKASTGGQPPILSLSTSRPAPTPDYEKDVAVGLPTLDPKQCPS